MFSAEFLITSLVVVVVPGTGVLYTVSTGLALRTRGSVAAAIGCTAGIVPHLSASILGLSAILHMSAVAFTVLKYAGAAYLLYLAWSMWRSTGTLSFNATPGRSGALRIIVRGILINLLNPKLTLFFFAFLPQFVSTGDLDPTRQMLVLSAVFMGMTLSVFTAYGLLASTVSGYLRRSTNAMKWIQRSFAVVFATLAVRLAVSDQ